VISLSVAMKPPSEANDFENVPMMRSTSLVTPKMVTCASSAFAEHSDTVGFVHHHGGVVFLGQTDDFGEVGDITFHGEHTVGDDEFHLVGFATLELLFESLHIVVFVFEAGREAQTVALR